MAALRWMRFMRAVTALRGKFPFYPSRMKE